MFKQQSLCLFGNYTYLMRARYVFSCNDKLKIATCCESEFKLDLLHTIHLSQVQLEKLESPLKKFLILRLMQ